MKFGLIREDALRRSKWSVGVNKIAAWLIDSDHPHLGIKPDFTLVSTSLSTYIYIYIYIYIYLYI